MSNPVQHFLGHIGRGELPLALGFIADDVLFEPQGPTHLPIYGRFEGKTGVERLFKTLAQEFETETFEIRKWAEADDVVFAHGFMQHRVRKTGGVVKSEFALVVNTANGLITHWRIFEDTAAFEAALG
ncbi:nuclear transport factor 2 family protein [Bradyrhizobium sp. STM 3562]|uniref:nuclear transport factor 2 family protein n=1 Tax=Bradyrhizobium sp. STM 3562 TaxID=578924 RepID=UPI00388D2817